MRSFSVLTALFLITISCKTKTVANAPSAKSSKNPATENKTGNSTPAKPFFTASGAEGWHVEMTPEVITFKPSEGEAITFPYVAPLNANEAQLKIFRSKSESHSIEITVTTQKCDAGTGKESYDIRVNLLKDGNVQKLTGCGSFSADAAINRVWTLHQLNGKTVTPDNFGQELPYIDIHTEISSFTGFGGCNRMKGSLGMYEPGSIRFYDVISTKMMCLEGNQENAFMRALQGATTYEVKNGNLYLLQGKEVVLMLKK